jgi:hypothetical protein
MTMVDLVQTIATQVGLIQRAAAHLKKDVRDITALDVATYRLHEHEEFVSKVELDKVVLFSHETALANYRAGVKAIASRYPDNKLPAWLEHELNENDKMLSERVANQEILELQVSEDVYQTAQANLFPSFVKKVRQHAQRTLHSHQSVHKAAYYTFHNPSHFPCGPSKPAMVLGAFF